MYSFSHFLTPVLRSHFDCFSSHFLSDTDGSPDRRVPI